MTTPGRDGLSPARETGVLRIALTGQALIQADMRVENQSVVDALKSVLSADVAFTDIETTIAEADDDVSGVNPAMGDVVMPPEALDALQEMGLNLFATGNNHSFDLGAVGMANLNRNLDARGLKHAGIGVNSHAAVSPTYLQTDKGRVALIATASGLLKPDSVATEDRLGVFEIRLEGATPDVDAGQPAEADTKRILASIREAAGAADFVISYHHNHTYDKNFVQMMRQQMPERLVPPPWVYQWAHAQIDAGADMVVMHGAPVCQGIEIYKGKPIFFGLGNFIFQMPLCIADFEALAYESVIAVIDVEGRTLKGITLHPIGIDPAGCGDDGRFSVLTRGLPRPLTGERGIQALQHVATLSRAFGTEFEIVGDTARLVLTDARIAQAAAG